MTGINVFNIFMVINGNGNVKIALAVQLTGKKLFLKETYYRLY